MLVLWRSCAYRFEYGVTHLDFFIKHVILEIIDAWTWF